MQKQHQDKQQHHQDQDQGEQSNQNQQHGHPYQEQKFQQQKATSFHTRDFLKRAQWPSREDSDTAKIHELIRPHIESFNMIFDGGLLQSAVQTLEAREVEDEKGNRLRYWLEDAEISKPLLSDHTSFTTRRFLMPAECRKRGISYSGKIIGRILYTINDGPIRTEARAMGTVPIMVRSNRCHLEDLSPYKMMTQHEEPEETGGYFIVNGIEKLIRLLIVIRRNHPLALVRPSFAKRGPLYTIYGIQIRCVCEDETWRNNFLHYLEDGSCMLRVYIRKTEYLLPLVLILRALIDTNDSEIIETLIYGTGAVRADEGQGGGTSFLEGRMENMLRILQDRNLLTRQQCLIYLGERMMTVLALSRGTGAEEAGKEFLRRYILVHLQDNLEKFRLLLVMLRKLYALVEHECSPDNPDISINQEVLLSGQVYLNCLREKLDDGLAAVRNSLLNELRRAGATFDLTANNAATFRRAVGKCFVDVGRKVEYFISTGNLNSGGLEMPQTAGFTIVAERLNFLRFISHFRSIHRGAFFAELKTTTVRKLQPESWGFLCPVHTPDGAPCGLLNHLAHVCRIATGTVSREERERLVTLLISLGCQPVERHYSTDKRKLARNAACPVLFDGRWVASIALDRLIPVARQLRHLKALGMVPSMMEVAAVPPSNGGLYPGLFLFTGAGRMMRPVALLLDGSSEGTRQETIYIGTLEQLYLDIAVRRDEIIQGVTEMVELAPTNMLSLVANLIPFPDFNQSPRNMYQCQMSKQSMATAVHNYPHRTDNKIYRLLMPQSPLVRTEAHNLYHMDDYPTGINAIVAVISYTGYDMEDAMIINKSSFERGFAHGTIYKSEFFDISEKEIPGEGRSHFFNLPSIKDVPRTLELDGLPAVGQCIQQDNPLFSVTDETTGKTRIEHYKDSEEAYVDQVCLLGTDGSQKPLQKILIRYRLPRNPVIGDKFSSRHGQKGVCSQQFPLADLPFTESGMTPDIIINPHAFPSRMTIGMFVESMAGKAGALHGLAQDATPFCFSEEHTATDYFGEQLAKAGYNYYGNEPMYSGITGVEMKADIYIGVVYYQRLRHMVSDKFQVRTIGPVHSLTQQPLKGRRRAGGIRFGEMERDSLLAHGVSFLLQDRLMNCSDYSQTYVCRRCGSIQSPIVLAGNASAILGLTAPAGMAAAGLSPKVICHICKHSDSLDVIAVPFVFRYLSAELMAMNVELKLHVN